MRSAEAKNTSNFHQYCKLWNTRKCDCYYASSYILWSDAFLPLSIDDWVRTWYIAPELGTHLWQNAMDEGGEYVLELQFGGLKATKNDGFDENLTDS